MSFLTFEPQLTSTPKKINIPNLCSTPRPVATHHIRYSLGQCLPFPVDSSTPNSKQMKKSFAPDIHRLIYPSKISTTHSMKIWVL